MSSPVTANPQEITAIYDAGLVVLSFAISFLGAYSTTGLCEQLRLSLLHRKEYHPFWYRLYYIVCASVALGGIGIWAMHFIGMGSLTLKFKHNDEVIPEHFNIAISITSLLVVLCMAMAGLMISSFDPMFMKTKAEVMEMFIEDSKHLTMKEIRTMTNTRLITIISTKSLHYLVAGGVIAGSGAGVMHYIGMGALDMNAKMTLSPGLVTLSVIIAIIAATAAFWILFRLLSLFPSKESLRLVVSFVMAIAVCGVHYTGMAAVSYTYLDHRDSMVEASGAMMEKRHAFTTVLIVAMIVLWLLTISVQGDLRYFVQRQLILASKQNNGNSISHIRSNNSLHSHVSHDHQPHSPRGKANRVLPMNGSQYDAQSISQSMERSTVAATSFHVSGRDAMDDGNSITVRANSHSTDTELDVESRLPATTNTAT